MMVLERHIVAAKQIQREVAAEHNMTRETMLYRGNSPGKVKARKSAMLRCRLELGMGYADIGRVFNMHHTTVTHHIGGVTAATLERDHVASLVTTVRAQAAVIADLTRHVTALSAALSAIAPQERAA
jgi:chromosomal replication initiation ATPase DnaA